ncbi:MAG TPA: hypothetical protein VIM73_08825 [Polyangiaceae bacterium]
MSERSESESGNTREDSSLKRRADEARVRALLRVAGTSTGVGLLLAAAGDASLARWITVLGLVLLVVGLHRLGRLGADPATTFEAPSQPQS